MDQTPNIAALTRAIREYNAAQNSVRRAYEELCRLLAGGVVVLHRRPEDTDTPQTYYWLYGPLPSDGIWGSGGRREILTPAEQTQAVIIAAPSPSAEYLPRLDNTLS